MKTNLIQRQLQINALAIFDLETSRTDIRAEAKAAQLKASRRSLYAAARKLGTEINKLAGLQRELKRDILAARFAKATVYKKHGKDDVRFTAWLEKHQAAERSGENYVAVEFFPPVVESISCGC